MVSAIPLKREYEALVNDFVKANKPLSQWEAAAMHIILQGGSIIDWKIPPKSNSEDASEILRLNELDLQNPLDNTYLSHLYREAILYLTEIHGYQMPSEIEYQDNIFELFAWARSKEASQELQVLSQMILKVIHVLHYLSARELLFRLPISDEELNKRVSKKVFIAIEKLRQSHVEVVEFSTGQKSRTSQLSKLMVKPHTKASDVFDRIRCRIVVKDKTNLIAAIRFLMHNLFPFNYIAPCESKNSIIPMEAIIALANYDPMSCYIDNQQNCCFEIPNTPHYNEFSGPTYKSINFIANLPLRIDDVLKDLQLTMPEHLGRIIFAQTEIQLLDEETATANEQGDNSHHNYKQRQLQRVRERLEIKLPHGLNQLDRIDLDQE